jgi:rubrerythrin
MSSEDDIKELFKDLLEQEKAVLKLYSKIIGEIKNGKIIGEISSIMKDEARHMKNAREMMEILEE